MKVRQRMSIPDAYYLIHGVSAEEFILGMLGFGTPVEMSIVGVFEPADTRGRASRRDKDLPLHRDGEYSAKLAEEQGGYYVEAKDVDLVGMYCLREGKEPCWTTIADNEGNETDAVDLKQGQALILNNRAVLHGRRGPVGERIVLRLWIKLFEGVQS